jgi:hypothetical protein
MARLYDALNLPYPLLGNRANLDTTVIPEYHRAFLFVKDWLRHILYTLDARQSHHMFLTLFMKAASFSFSSDRNETRYVYGSPCVNLVTPPAQYLRGALSYNVVWDLLDFLEGSKPTCLSAGVSFLR